MNTLPAKTKALIIKCLVEGMSIRSTSRIADVSRNTVTKLLVDAGKVCSDCQDKALRNLNCTRIEVDEIWSFVYAKNKNVPTAKNPPRQAGDVWTWTAICADARLVPSWRLGDRTSAAAIEFMDDLRSRLDNRVQLTSDGHKACLEAVEGAFGGSVDYAQLVRIYGGSEDLKPESRCSPGKCNGLLRNAVEGNPNPDNISASYAERQNLTRRMSMRRFARLANAFSRKIENHAHAVALHFMHYNFCRIHQTLKVTPAMEAGVTNRLWDVSDIVKLVEDAQPAPIRPKTYKKKSHISN